VHPAARRGLCGAAITAQVFVEFNAPYSDMQSDPYCSEKENYNRNCAHNQTRNPSEAVDRYFERRKASIRTIASARGEQSQEEYGDDVHRQSHAVSTVLVIHLRDSLRQRRFTEIDGFPVFFHETLLWPL